MTLSNNAVTHAVSFTLVLYDPLQAGSSRVIGVAKKGARERENECESECCSCIWGFSHVVQLQSRQDIWWICGNKFVRVRKRKRRKNFFSRTSQQISLCSNSFRCNFQFALLHFQILVPICAIYLLLLQYSKQ